MPAQIITLILLSILPHNTTASPITYPYQQQQHQQFHIPLQHQANSPFQYPYSSQSPQPQLTHNIHFEHLGFVQEAAAFTHVTIPIDLTGLQPFCNTQPHLKVKSLLEIYSNFTWNIKARINDKLAVMEAPMGPALKNTTISLLNSTAHLLEQNCNITNGWATGDLVLSPQDLPRRHKRYGAPALFALGSAFGGFITNWIQSSKISQLENKMEIHNAQIEEILNAYDDAASAISRLETLMAHTYRQQTVMAYAASLQAHSQSAARTIDRIHATITSLYSGKLSLSTIAPHQLHTIFKTVQTLAKENDVTLPITSPLQLLELPATFTKYPSGITIQLFIPLISRQFTLYKYLNTPVFVQGNSSSRLAAIQTDHRLIAIDDDGSPLNVPMTHADLDACLRLGNHHLCTDLVKHVRYESSCIGNMFSRTPDKVLSNCAFHWDPQPWRFDKRSNSTYLLSTTIPIALQIQCFASDRRFNPADRQHYTAKVGQTQLHVPPGCTLTTPEIAISGSQLSIAPIGLTMPINWDIQDSLLQGLDLQALEEVSEKIQSHGLGTSPSIKRQIRLHQTLPDHTLSQTQHALLAVMITLLAAICTPLVIFLIRHFRRAARERNHPLHGALRAILRRAPIEPLQETNALGPPAATPQAQVNIYPNPHQPPVNFQLPNVPDHEVQ